MTTTTYTKLRSGDWGVRVHGIARAGETVTVVRRDGQSREETIQRVIWSGNGVSLCAIGSSRSPQHGGSGRSGRGTWTGCSCGSIEEYERARDCPSCRHDR